MIVVEIAPGPESSGMASGTTAMLSLSSASFASSGVCCSPLVAACIIDMASNSMRIAPPTLNEAMVMPKNPRRCSPTTAETVRTTATETLATRAMRFLSETLCLWVRPRNIGIVPIGLTITSKATKIFTYSAKSSMGEGCSSARTLLYALSVTPNPGLRFAPEHDRPIAYMQRTRDWYLALGYGNPYVWAHYADAPFQLLKTPLARSRVTLIPTAAPFQPDKGDQGPGAAYNSAAKFYSVYSGDTSVDHDLRIAHVAIDRKHTSMEDSGTWFPLPALRKIVAAGRVQLAKRFHGAPTHRSQKHTIDVDCPEILARCVEDEADAALLVTNCPVCHQTVSLIARHLEANGIPTVVIGCAKDIVEHCGVPRFLFSDFPLGNSAGRPHDAESQAQTLELALRVLESAPAARTTVQSPLRWNGAAAWKRDYLDLVKLSPDTIAERRKESDEVKTIARAKREGS